MSDSMQTQGDYASTVGSPLSILNKSHPTCEVANDRSALIYFLLILRMPSLLLLTSFSASSAVLFMYVWRSAFALALKTDWRCYILILVLGHGFQFYDSINDVWTQGFTNIFLWSNDCIGCTLNDLSKWAPEGINVIWHWTEKLSFLLTVTVYWYCRLIVHWYCRLVFCTEGWHKIGDFILVKVRKSSATSSTWSMLAGNLVPWWAQQDLKLPAWAMHKNVVRLPYWFLRHDSDIARHFTISGFDLITCATCSRKDVTDVPHHLSTLYYGVVKVGLVSIVNVYKPPIEAWETGSSLPVLTHHAMCVGDFNSHSPEWGYNDTDSQGQKISSWASCCHLGLTYDLKQKGRTLTGMKGNLCQWSSTASIKDRARWLSARSAQAICHSHRADTTSYPQCRKEALELQESRLDLV